MTECASHVALQGNVKTYAYLSHRDVFTAQLELTRVRSSGVVAAGKKRTTDEYASCDSSHVSDGILAQG